MKRGNIVLNRRLFHTGKALADWAKSGMNWAAGPGRDAVMRHGRAVLASPVLCQTLAVCHNNLLDDLGEHQATQSTVSATLAAMVDGDHKWRINLLRQAEPDTVTETEEYPIDCPDGEYWGTRTIDTYASGALYHHGYRAGGTWVDGWWS